MSTYEISKSSLLSLKAEILRKQDEVNKAKLQNRAKAEQEPKKGTPLELKNKGVAERAKFDTVEDEDLLKKSKEVLEAKSKLYDQLSQGKRKVKGSERFLVQFGRKLTYAKPPDGSDEDDYDRYPESEEERHFSDEYELPQNREDEWVEYVDCLGRTRKCLRRDLEHIKQKDTELKSTIRKEEESQQDKDDNKDKRSVVSETERIEFDENSELLSNDMRTELLRQKWEKEEEELRKKSDIHYQDVLFDEARVHGVGYYGFSKDDRERTRQQEALKKLREETQREQQKAEEKRKLRDSQLAARARAARNRKRARMGLPPEEENEEQESINEEKQELEDKVKSPEEIEMEKKREEQRKKHIRPWDIGKEGVKEEVTQEEWVHKRRRERMDEFAPPKAYSDRKRKDFDTSKPPPKINNPSKKHNLNFYRTEEIKKRSYVRRPIECSDSESDEENPKINNPSKKHSLNPYKTEEIKDYKTTKRSYEKRPIVNECSDSESDEEHPKINNPLKKHSLNPYKIEEIKDYKTTKRSYEKRPIVNECSDSESDEDELMRDYERSRRVEDNRRRGVEIAPPPTFDYYGPSSSKKSKSKDSKSSDISESITAGLQFLRQQAEKKGKNRDSDMFIM